MRLFGKLAIGFLCAVMLAPLPGASAQVPDMPPVFPEACTIAPSDVPDEGDVGDLTMSSPTPTPISESNAVPADDATRTAVTETIAQSIACQNAGDVLRMLSCFTEGWISQRFAGYDLVYYGAFLETAAQATPLPAAEQIELVAIDDVQIQDDGSALATVVTRAHGEEQRSLLVLVEAAGDWLIDGGEIASLQ